MIVTVLLMKSWRYAQDETSFKCDRICFKPLFLKAGVYPLGGSGMGISTGTGMSTSTGVFMYLRVFKP